MCPVSFEGGLLVAWRDGAHHSESDAADRGGGGAGSALLGALRGLDGTG